MSHFKLFIAAALASLALAVPAHADKTAGQQVDDATIATSVKTTLIGTKGVSSTAINVETNLGVVSLGGFVESEAEKKAALDAAKSVSGVKKVYDGLVVIKKDRSAGQAIDDTTIQATLKTKLAEFDTSKAWNINTDVYNGHVLLSGFIHGEKNKEKAVEIARGIKGVKHVYDKLELK
jgi:hyperosmotically inducible protein